MTDSAIAWVTGGGTGIGLALAKQLYQEGRRVIISGRRSEVLNEAVRQISSGPGPGKIRAFPGNAADPIHIAQVVGETKSSWGDISVLINNAGSNSNHPIQSTPPQEYVEAFENNCMSAIRTTHAVLPAMLATGRGAIVNISSVYGRWGTATSASYSVSKFAIAGYTEALRQSLVGSRIRVLSVFPGYIKTAMTNPFVKEGSLRSYMGETPEQMACAILVALKTRRQELYFPWYVPWVLRLHRWAPTLADQLAARTKR